MNCQDQVEDMQAGTGGSGVASDEPAKKKARVSREKASLSLSFDGSSHVCADTAYTNCLHC